jgi:hypothetical protein
MQQRRCPATEQTVNNYALNLSSFIVVNLHDHGEERTESIKLINIYKMKCLVVVGFESTRDVVN